MATRKTPDKKRLTFVTNKKIYNWVSKSAKDMGITMSAFMSMKMAEVQKQEEALKTLTDIVNQSKIDGA